MANPRIDAPYATCLQTIQALGAALDTPSFSSDITMIAAQSSGHLARIGTQITNLTTQVGTIQRICSHCAQQAYKRANQTRPESYVNSAPEWDGSGKSQEAQSLLGRHSPTGLVALGRQTKQLASTSRERRRSLAMSQEDGKGDGGKWTPISIRTDERNRSHMGPSLFGKQ